jgi:hypothetical protein
MFQSAKRFTSKASSIYGNAVTLNAATDEKKPPKRPVSRANSGVKLISGDFQKTLRQSTPTAT